MYPVFLTLCVRLHNFVTEHLINDEIIDVFENGEKIQTRELVLKTKKLAAGVTCRSVTLSVIDTKSNRASYTTISKLLGSAERDIEIARVRGITLAEVFSHDDHLLTSHLFDGDFTYVTHGSIGGISQR